jgi:hypothetical protein
VPPAPGGSTDLPRVQAATVPNGLGFNQTRLSYAISGIPSRNRAHLNFSVKSPFGDGLREFAGLGAEVMLLELESAPLPLQSRCLWPVKTGLRFTIEYSA